MWIAYYAMSQYGFRIGRYNISQEEMPADDFDPRYKSNSSWLVPGTWVE